ncbi:MAG: tRNA pseudouridine(38-40) synthase TruA [Marmoricola sp.]
MRLRLDLAYDGARFHGWARQPGLRTVQGTLELALATVLRIPEVRLTCAGRTDAGVHARGQVAHLDLEALPPLRRPVADGADADEACLAVVTRKVNGVLPSDVRLHRLQPARPGFDARFSATWRRYAYRIADRPELVDPLTRGHVVAWARPLDDTAMDIASRALVGEHDFAAYCKRREGATTIRSLQQLSWRRTGNGVLVGTVVADAFCHHMVRGLVGALVAVGEGRRPLQWPAEVLAAGVRHAGVAVAPAHGLTLEEVGYPDDEQLAARADRTRRLRTKDERR